MHDIVGLEHFSEYFSDFKEDFIIIGGVATVIQLNQLGFDTRVTKDIDMIILYLAWYAVYHETSNKDEGKEPISLKISSLLIAGSTTASIDSIG